MNGLIEAAEKLLMQLYEMAVRMGRIRVQLSQTQGELDEPLMYLHHQRLEQLFTGLERNYHEEMEDIAVTRHELMDLVRPANRSYFARTLEKWHKWGYKQGVAEQTMSYIWQGKDGNGNDYGVGLIDRFSMNRESEQKQLAENRAGEMYHKFLSIFETLENLDRVRTPFGPDVDRNIRSFIA